MGTEAGYRKGFNPCFNGTTSATTTGYLYYRDDSPVSILVLMELPLQQGQIELENGDIISFNPCFNGTTSATLSRRSIYARYTSVSILVLMELPLQPNNGFNNDSAINFCFNPCFNGTTSAT